MQMMIRTSKIAKVQLTSNNVWKVSDQVAVYRNDPNAVSICHNRATAQKLARAITAKHTTHVPAYVHPDTPTYGERLNAWIQANKKG
jgi:hypothetical protein